MSIASHLSSQASIDQSRYANLLFRVLPQFSIPWLCTSRNAFARFSKGLNCYNSAISTQVEVPCSVNENNNSTIVIKGDVQELTENGIIFVGEDKEIKCDAIILWNQLEIFYPTSEKDALASSIMPNLYKSMFVPEIAQSHTLAFIGVIGLEPSETLFPLFELQSRWFALLMSGSLKLPSTSQMLSDIRRKKKFDFSASLNILAYLEDIAMKINCKPNLFNFAIKDPVLWKRLFFGHFNPIRYRLQGPHSWNDARNQILNVQEQYQFSTPNSPKAKDCSHKTRKL